MDELQTDLEKSYHCHALNMDYIDMYAKVKDARKRVIVAKKLTNAIRKQSSSEDKKPIFKQFHKYIIGKGGANIRRIRDETDTRVDLPDSGSDSDMITITGKKANVNKAVEEIQKIQSEMANIVSKEVKIPAKIHNTMIGAGGKLIQSIMNECGGVRLIIINTFFS